MSLGRPPKDESRDISDMLGCGTVTGAKKTRPTATCTEGSGSKGTMDSPASVASCDSLMTRSRYRSAGISPMIHNIRTPSSQVDSPATKDREATSKQRGGGSFAGMARAAFVQAAGGASEKRGKGKAKCLKTTSRGWSYKARLALCQKVLEHKVFTGTLLARQEAFAGLLHDALGNASTREYFEGRTAQSVRSYWASMKREHAAAEKESSASGSSVQVHGDDDYAAWIVGMQKVLDEIAGYNSATKGRERDEKRKADAASRIRNDGLSNCSPRGVRGTSLDYSSSESDRQEMNTKPIGYCDDLEVLSVKDSPSVFDSTNTTSSNPPSSGKRKGSGESSEMAGSSAKGKPKRRRRNKFATGKDDLVRYITKGEEEITKVENERQLREKARLVQEQEQWKQDREDRLAREAFDREERKHDCELKAEIEKARLAAETQKNTEQSTMMMSIITSLMKSKE